MSNVPYDLERALSEPGCPICRVVHRREEAWIFHILYEFVSDPGVRRRFDATQGFCRAHANLAMNVRDATNLGFTGIAQVYESIVRRYRRQVNELKHPRRAWFRHRHSATAHDDLRKQGCMLCEVHQRVSEALIFFLLEALSDGGAEWRLRFEDCEGLCNPHFLAALRDPRAEHNRGLWSFIVQDQERRMADLEERLHQFQRKLRYDVHEEITAQEAGSWQEAMWRFTGMEYKSLLWRLPGL